MFSNYYKLNYFAVGRQLDYIIDLTMAYDEEKNLNFYRMFVPTRGFDVSVYTRVFAASEIPTDDEDLLKWMIDRWSEKERRMEYFAEHKSFPVLPEDERHRAPGVSLVRAPKQVQLMTPSRFSVHMFFTTVPGLITLCVLIYMLYSVYTFLVKLGSLFL